MTGSPTTPTLGRSPAEATDRLAAAIAELTHSHVRPRVIAQIKLASLTMATGDPVGAVAIGTTALDEAQALRSRRTLDELRELSRHAAAHQRTSEVAHLRQQIGTLVLAS